MPAPEEPSRAIGPRYVKTLYLYIFVPNPSLVPCSYPIDILALKMALPLEGIGKNRGLCWDFSTLVKPFECHVGLSSFWLFLMPR